MSEAALAFTTVSLPSRPETTSVRVPSLSPIWIGRRSRLSGDDDDAVILPRFAHDGGRGQGQDIGVFFSDDGRVGVEAGKELRARIRNIDLDADRPRLWVRAPTRPD